MKIIEMNISELSPDPANVRKHGEKNLEAIKGSLRKFKQQKPIVVDKNNVVIAGNGTLQAAKALGWEKINVVKTELTGTEAIAFALADNKTAELAEWDDEGLVETLNALVAEGFEVEDFGFDKLDFDISDGQLPDSLGPEEKNLCQMSFILHVDQRDQIMAVLKDTEKIDYPQNENGNGNKLWWLLTNDQQR